MGLIFRSLVLLGTQLVTLIAATASPIFVIEIQDDSSDVQQALDNVAAFTLENGAKTNVRYIYDTDLFRGFSFELDGAAATTVVALLRDQPGTKNFWTLPPKDRQAAAKPPSGASPVEYRRNAGPIAESLGEPRDKPQKPRSNGYIPHMMTGVNKLHDANVKGHGVTVAIIDGCFDYKRDVFGGSIGPGKKITYSYNWVTNSPDVYCTCDIHGIGMLSTVAANPTSFDFVGVAPEASIELRTFSSCEDPSISDDLLVYTVSNVAKRNVDVISFSVNTNTNTWPNDFRSVIVSRIQQNGTFVSVSSGNGRGKAFTIQAPASGIDVPAVASVNNAITPYVFWNGSYSLDGVFGGTVDWMIAQVGYGGPRFAPRLKVWAPSFSYAGPEAFRNCTELPPSVVSTLPSYDDTIILLSDDDCFNVNGTYILALPWKYALFYSPRPTGNISIVNNNFNAFTPAGSYLGAGSISWEQANNWVQHIKAGKDLRVTLATPDNYVLSYQPVKDNITGGRMNDASLWGPTLDSRVGPTFAAPGGRMLNMVPKELGNFIFVTGTSTAAAFAAGCAALLKQMHPDWNANTIRNALALTARPMPNNDLSSKSFGFLAPTQQQGGGLVDAYAAAYGTTLVNVSSLSFNTTRNLRKSVAFRITNTAATSVSYNLHHIPAAAFYGFTDSDRSTLTTANTVTYPPESVSNAAAQLAISPSSVTIPAHGSTDVTVSLVSLPQGLDTKLMPIYGGYITLNNSDSLAATGDRFDLSIPYTGIAAELYGISVLNDIAVYSVSPDGSSGTPVEANGHIFNVTYTNGTITGSELPGFPISWVLASQRLTIDLVKYPSNESIIPKDYDDFPNVNDYWYWDGTDGNNKFIPAGKYYWRASALQLEGDYNNAADYVVKTTGWFEIRYTSNSTGFP